MEEILPNATIEKQKRHRMAIKSNGASLRNKKPISGAWPQ